MTRTGGHIHSSLVPLSGSVVAVFGIIERWYGDPRTESREDMEWDARSGVVTGAPACPGRDFSKSWSSVRERHSQANQL